MSDTAVYCEECDTLHLEPHHGLKCCGRVLYPVPEPPRKRLTQQQAEGLAALAALGGLLLLGQALYDAACDRVAEQNKRRVR